MKRILFLLTFTSCILSLYAQNLYWPRDLKKAYKNETRSNDGRPGNKYWQNTGRYNITVTALPPDRTIKGSEQISYINNSPDTLSALVFKFIQNIHQPGVTRLGPAPADYLTDGVHVDKYVENGQTRKWAEHGYPSTIQFIRLSKPLMPHDSVQLGFDWHFQISLKSGREGMIDSTTYFLAYFYPRVAVFDDVDGWDRMTFTDAQEFYSDFNDYTVTINAPGNFIVWGTGTLQHPETLLQPEFAR